MTNFYPRRERVEVETVLWTTVDHGVTLGGLVDKTFGISTKRAEDIPNARELSVREIKTTHKISTTWVS